MALRAVADAPGVDGGPLAASSTLSTVLPKVLENVLTNLLTVVVLPLLIPLLCLLVGAVVHVARGDAGPWWQSVRDFVRLAGGGPGGGGAGRPVRYWLALLAVLLRGRLSDPDVLASGRRD